MIRSLKVLLAPLILSALLLAACGTGAPPPAGDPPATAGDPIKIGVLRIDDSIPFYVAEKEGLFAAGGVAVELAPFNSSADQSKAMEAGELDMAMNDMIVQALMRKGGTATKAVAVAFGATPAEGRFLLVGAPGSGLTPPAPGAADNRIVNAEGKTVAISSNTMMDYLLAQFAGMGFFAPDLSDVRVISMPNLMLRVEALIEGRDVQMAILPDPLASYAVLAGCPVLVDDTALGVNLSQSVVLATETALNERRDEVSRVLAAYFTAMERINENPEAYRDFCLETANVPAELSAVYPTPSYTPGALPTAADVARVMDWLVERGLLTEPYSYAEMADGSLAANLSGAD
ncbi:MAG: ABC transporter substrate-binding protein [Gracilibacteraceae bacterium]|jgi:NitT/TauT family transport system substrate-binding protein|nr:ABC transporter substrate-binding protein [Gracilibacteraceae bacterium]